MSDASKPTIDPERFKKFLNATLLTGSHDASTGEGCIWNWGNFVLSGAAVATRARRAFRPPSTG
jgi:hypothetical protein